MFIKKIVISLSLNLLLVVLVSSIAFIGCGKKESTEKSAGDKQEETSGSKTDNITENTPVYYELEATGEITGYWKVYAEGKKAKVDMDLTTLGKKTNSTMYTDGTMMYFITDVAGTKTGMKMDIAKFREENQKKGEFNPINFKDGCKDCEKIGTEDVIGKPCVIYQDKKGIKYSVYQDIYPLKVVMPKTTITAKKIEINVKVSDDMFTPPKDVNYIEMDKMMEGFKNPQDLKNMEEQLNKLKK